MRTLGLVPARGGSLGIPRKNVRPFLGRPLLAWSVDAGVGSGVLERVVVSTEDAEIAGIARAAGAEVVDRQVELAGDEVSTAAVVRHALETLGWDFEAVVILEPTSPLRRPEHVREAVALLADADSVASVSEVPHHHVPSKLLRFRDDGTIEGIGGVHPRDMTHRRQDLPVVYAFDGNVFACRAEVVRVSEPPTIWGERVRGMHLDARYSVDLDRPDAWQPAEARMRELLGA